MSIQAFRTIQTAVTVDAGSLSPMFATILRAAECLEACLLEIPDVVCPAIFVCLNIGTRQPWPTQQEPTGDTET